jgi:hypothetical protein
LQGRRLLSRDLGYRLGDVRFTRETEIGLDFRIMDDRFSIGFAPGEAAASSLSTGQDFKNLFHLGVDLDGKFLSRHGEPNAEDEPDASEHGDGNESHL